MLFLAQNCPMLNPESHGHWMCKDRRKCDRKPGCMLMLVCNEGAAPVGNAELTCHDTGGNMEWLPNGIGHCEKKCKAKTTVATTTITSTITTTTVKGSLYAASRINGLQHNAEASCYLSVDCFLIFKL